jgi:SAM-dependent MidA family methyltransferase
MEQQPNKHQLAQPDDNAKRHSQQLMEHIIDQINLSGGQISFEKYMQLALYAPGLGYYSAGMHKFGQQGDFVTAPEISPLFGQVLAIQAEQVLKQIRKIQESDNNNNTDILEVGAGSGKMAGDILIELQKRNCLPEHYYILELSADLKQRQQHYLKQVIPHFFDRITWLVSLPDGDFNGLVIANELLDAFPIHLVKFEEKQLFERFVVIERDEVTKTEKLVFKDFLIKESIKGNITESAKNKELLAIKEKIETNVLARQELYDLSQATNSTYITEVNLLAKQWIKSIAKSINCGAVLLIDYGYPESEYLHPQRNMGTLMCHYRHLAHDEPFFYPGLQDITAHVNFTDIKNAAEESGMDLKGYTTQTHFLLAGGLVELTEHVDINKIKEHAKMVVEIKRLTLPEEMGELFKVIYLTKNMSVKNMSQTISGFSFNNMRDKL